MDPVKVDPKLFVTCRLCMETMGLYQITPAVQEQFKYCFDIDVSPFDGLPQLICEECQTVLNDYSTKKRIYSGRQNALHVRWQIRKEIGLSINDQPQQQNTVSSSLSGINDVKNKTVLETRRASKVSYPDSDRSRSNTPLAKKRKFNIDDKDEIQNRKPVTKFYTKKIICRFCGKLFKHKGNLRSHLRTHDHLLNQYSNILKQTCLVYLGERSDELRPDNILSSSTVMLEPSRIIGQEEVDSIRYCTLYTPKLLDGVKCKLDEHTSESDSDEALIKYGSKYNKRPRILSTDTLVLSDGDESTMKKKITLHEVEVHTENKDELNQEIECIDIDDSSNASSVYDNNIDDNGSKDIESDAKIIEKIVNLCYQKLEDKSESESAQANADPGILKHKLLSIGRKLINKEGINCVGLLRYMECKNLEIKWISSLNTHQNANVYVMPKLKDLNEKSPSDSMYWKKVMRKDAEILRSKELNVKTSVVPGAIKNLGSNNKLKPLNRNMTKVQPIDVIDKEVNSSCRTTDANDVNPTNVLQHSDLSKILNANPVANPKQLPKKTNVAEKYNLHMWQNSTGETSVNQGECESLPKITSTTSLAPLFCDENMSDNLHNMPIIESTISLAETGKTTANNANDTTSGNISHPRIKVKNVSELMSDPALISYNQQQALACSANINQSLNNVNAASNLNLFVSFPPAQIHNNVSNNVVGLPNMPGDPNSNNDKSRVILDTVAFPNTLTDSPFRYFKNLLHVHDIILLDSDKPIPREFTCLIKFKIQFSRETENQPLRLYLSVNCYKNMFYLGVGDMNQINAGRPIDINKLSATWQWHILQIYATTQDVIDKITMNAMSLGTDVVQYTATFLNLLRSIKLKQP